MSFAALFSTAGSLAMLGWLSLALAILFRWPRLRDWGAGLVIPLALSVLYTALIGIYWWDADGGFDRLDRVRALFQSDGLLLAGWVHYLAYDLFVGAWIARDAAERHLPRGLLIPVLPLAFLFAPAGFLLWVMIRTAQRASRSE